MSALLLKMLNYVHSLRRESSPRHETAFMGMVLFVLKTEDSGVRFASIFVDQKWPSNGGDQIEGTWFRILFGA